MLKNVTLEMSLKPFRQLDDEYIANVCREVFSQWKNLTDNAEMVSVLLWTADGSELLDYRGSLDGEIEWARYIGGANPKGYVDRDPEGKCLHSDFHLYMDNPPVVIYNDLKRIVCTIKQVGSEFLGKEIRVGTTFDPGPEFAKSPFKYEKHPEICIADSMGEHQNKFVACVSTLKADDVAYAGFPNGVEDGTHIGTFLGRQANCFIKDMGFDYIWLSNGFGFGTETWEVKGSLFDGSSFDSQKALTLRERVMAFWHNFRRECPDYLVETRGTNLTTGIDLSTDAVDIRGIYEGGFNMTTPPNSPWAALDGDFGLELSGYMSHIAQLPVDNSYFVFRFYLHDPWWLNSPWIDRYEKCPHDIYMPLAVSRIDDKGEIENASAVELLTIDDSYGKMPLECPLEVTPHLNEALKSSPDLAGPLVWVYPFEQYHDMTFGENRQLQEVFFGDWFIRDVINDSVPLNTVISSMNFQKVFESSPEKFTDNVIVTTLPVKGSTLASLLSEFINNGGKVLFYGPVKNADTNLLNLLGMKVSQPVSGELTLKSCLSDIDSQILMHEKLVSGGGCCAVGDTDEGVFATVSNGTESRLYSVYKNIGKGSAGWVRGTNSGTYVAGHHLLKEYDRQKYICASSVFRSMLNRFDYQFEVDGNRALQKLPSFCISRNENAFYFAGYSRNTNVGVSWRMPQGAPVLNGLETIISEGKSHYKFLRAWRYECRVFVDQQEESEIFCNEEASVQVGVKRRIIVRGLKNATLRFYNEPGTQDFVKMLHEPQWPFVTGDWLDFEYDKKTGCCVVKNVTGSVMIIW